MDRTGNPPQSIKRLCLLSRDDDGFDLWQSQGFDLRRVEDRIVYIHDNALSFRPRWVLACIHCKCYRITVADIPRHGRIKNVFAENLPQAKLRSSHESTMTESEFTKVNHIRKPGKQILVTLIIMSTGPKRETDGSLLRGYH